jgi:hypothetical protein
MISSGSYKNMSKEELFDIIVDLANTIYRQNKDLKYYYLPIDLNKLESDLDGDCMAQCLNCIRAGYEDGYQCKCGNPQWSMDSSAIRREGGKV